jgi:phosphopantetheine adenylyltransferase/dephospho-CoA kinase
VQVFGEDIVGQDGLINRKKLGGIVFSDKSEMKKLTDIVWPEIGLIVKKQVEEFRNSANTETQIMVVEAAVLVEAKWFDIPDVIWTLEIPEEIAVERIIERNNISREDAIARIRSQVSSEQRRTYARVEINTNRPKSETRQIILHVRKKKLISLLKFSFSF